jgi:hypothetical protein
MDTRVFGEPTASPEPSPEHDPRLNRRMRSSRLEQIAEHIRRVEDQLANVRELVTRMQAADGNDEAPSIRDTQLASDRSVTSACWGTADPGSFSASL